MRYLKFAFRKLFRKGEHSTARIVSLATGLAFGLILLAEVFYYYSFDSFYRFQQAIRGKLCGQARPVIGRIDRLRGDGAIGPGLAEVPGIEAPRVTPWVGVDFSPKRTGAQSSYWPTKFTRINASPHVENAPRC